MNTTFLKMATIEEKSSEQTKQFWIELKTAIVAEHDEI